MYCFVSGCPNANNGTKESKKARMVQIFFSAPEDESLFKLWQSAVPRSKSIFSRNDKLCDFHFKKSEVVLFNETKLPNGNVRRVPASEPKLKAGTVPSIFPAIKNLSTSDVEKTLVSSPKINLPESQKSKSKRKLSSSDEAEYSPNPSPRTRGRPRKLTSTGGQDNKNVPISKTKDKDLIGSVISVDDDLSKDYESDSNSIEDAAQSQPSIRLVPISSLLAPSQGNKRKRGLQSQTPSPRKGARNRKRKTHVDHIVESPAEQNAKKKKGDTLRKDATTKEVPKLSGNRKPEDVMKICAQLDEELGDLKDELQVSFGDYEIEHVTDAGDTEVQESGEVFDEVLSIKSDPDDIEEKKTLEELAAELAGTGPTAHPEYSQSAEEVGGTISEPRIMEVLSLCGIDDEGNLVRDKSSGRNDNDIEREIAKMLGEEDPSQVSKQTEPEEKEHDASRTELGTKTQESLHVPQNEEHSLEKHNDADSGVKEKSEIAQATEAGDKEPKSLTNEESEHDSDVGNDPKSQVVESQPSISEGDSGVKQSQSDTSDENLVDVIKVLKKDSKKQSDVEEGERNDSEKERVDSETNIIEGALETLDSENKKSETEKIPCQSDLTSQNKEDSENDNNESNSAEEDSVSNKSKLGCTVDDSNPEPEESQSDTTAEPLKESKSSASEIEKSEESTETTTESKKKSKGNRKEKLSSPKKPRRISSSDVEEIPSSPDNVLNISSDSEADPTWAPTADAVEVSDDNDTDPGSPSGEGKSGKKSDSSKKAKEDSSLSTTAANDNYYMVSPEVSKILSPDTLQQIIKTLKLPLNTPIAFNMAKGITTDGVILPLSSNKGRPMERHLASSASVQIFPTQGRNSNETFVPKTRRVQISVEKSKRCEKLLGIKMFEGLGKIKKAFDFSTFLSDAEDELQFKKFSLIVKECLRDVCESKNAVTNIGKLTINISHKTLKNVMPVPDLEPIVKVKKDLKSANPSVIVKRDVPQENSDEVEMFECITVDSNVENHYENTTSIENAMELEETPA